MESVKTLTFIPEMDAMGLKRIEDAINEKIRKELEEKRLEVERAQKAQLAAQAEHNHYIQQKKCEAPMRLTYAKTIFDWVQEFRKTSQCELLFKQNGNQSLCFWRQGSYCMRLRTDGLIEMWRWRKNMTDVVAFIASTASELAEHALMLSYLQDAENRIMSRQIWDDLIVLNNL